jgi:hypothetical protein
MPKARQFAQVGQRFGRGVVIDPEIRKAGHRFARLRCDCGNEYEARISSLLAGRPGSQSCGCQPVVSGHGLSRHPLYQTWYDMLSRCENPAHPAYRNYGGRGIRVCDRWHDVAVFVADIERWLGPKPPGTSLDRIMNDHDYRQDNVRWGTWSEQNSNRRRLRA